MRQPLPTKHIMYRFSLLLAFLCLLPKPAPAQAPNGAPPRPFYIFAHNPNTIAEATNALAHGANALEPDIQRFDAGNFPWYANGTLIVYHDPGPLYTRQPDTLTSYLDKLHQVALDYPQLALVVFDVKTEAVSPQHGQEIK